MPALAHHFGVRPWEIDLLTVPDFHTLCAAADELKRQMEESTSGYD